MNQDQSKSFSIVITVSIKPAGTIIDNQFLISTNWFNGSNSPPCPTHDIGQQCAV